VVVAGVVVGGVVVGGGGGMLQPFARIARPCVVLFNPLKLLGGMLNAGMMSPHSRRHPCRGRSGRCESRVRSAQGLRLRWRSRPR